MVVTKLATADSHVKNEGPLVARLKRKVRKSEYLSATDEYFHRREIHNFKILVVEARVGFEPTNGGFADLSLGPLGYRAERVSIAKFLLGPGNCTPEHWELRFIFLYLPPAG